MPSEGEGRRLASRARRVVLTGANPVPPSLRERLKLAALPLLSGAPIMARLEALAALSEQPDTLTRTFMSAAQRDASLLVVQWMQQAGMSSRIDAAGNVVGRIGPSNLPALMIGSHLDTVRDAGKYDGMLGVVTAIECVGALHEAGYSFNVPVEIYGFSDEEGTRFGTTMLGSRAVTGKLDQNALDRTDETGISMSRAFQMAGFDIGKIPCAKRDPAEFAAYIELHIEQGPVLEAENLPAGCVTAISGAARYEFTVKGRAGHAGTVPMHSRQDALAAAAACVVEIEKHCAAQQNIVGTVGVLHVPQGAINVIAGRAHFTLDIRAPSDRAREIAEVELLSKLQNIADQRKVTLASKKIYTLPATPCAPWLIEQIDASLNAFGITPRHLPSGAGHDGAAIADIADIGMIFVRCAGGISHSPDECIMEQDAAIGANILLHFIQNFQPKPGTPT